MTEGKSHDEPSAAIARRWEVSILVGPCSDEEVEALMEAVADLPECQNIGGCVAAGVYDEVNESTAFAKPVKP